MKETLKDKPLMIQLGTLVSVIIFVVGSTWYVSQTLGAMMLRIETLESSHRFEIDDTNRRIDHLSEKYTTVRSDITALQTQNTEVKAQLSVVQAILQRVEITLQEIKQAIK